jgi:hypothetical protein
MFWIFEFLEVRIDFCLYKFTFAFANDCLSFARFEVVDMKLFLGLILFIEESFEIFEVFISL